MYASERLKGIDVFVAVAEMGSFSAAAERLSLSGSAVSKGVARLEVRLGARLFNRTTRRLSLTEAGVLFYKTCTGVLADLEEAEQAIFAESDAPHGKVRIDLPAAFGRLHVLPLIVAFTQAHPRLQPHVSFSDRYIDPVQEGVDILVRIGGGQAWPAALGHQYFGAQRLAFCASPDYLTRHGTPQDEQALERHLCIGYGEATGLVTPWYLGGGLPGEVRQRIVQPHLAIGDGEGMLGAVLAGLGIGQLPTWLTRSHIERGTLVEVLPQLTSQGLPMNLVWLKRREGLPKVRTLLDYLLPRLTAEGSLGEPQARQ
ncbi:MULTISPECIES: LysR family transcriptional regulator [Pseudomonas]|uniref:LysR family transcriptional regulator n=1 Tax=Pseudomonas TaxID=286 RepID=UPI001E4C955E|nr:MULTISPECIES: LysR family transcriptional regulator [Pseudomonas]MCX5509853.1 LysR family transcriptional regulator [Pseudomonas sp. BJa3]WJO19386.1 LysR family transcriptional regulator [Pseudomonas soli]